MKRYVQHKSGIGEKWAVHSDTTHTWTVHSVESGLGAFTIPKSEYHEVPAPEMWERIGDDRITVRTDNLSLVVDGKQVAYLPPGYRWAWDQQEDGTLCIERKVTE